MLVLAIEDLRLLLRTADVAAAMSVEAQLGTDRVFAAELQAIRPHPGQAASAANLVALLADSGVVASHRGPDCNRVQDAYSLRCSPQVQGAARDTVEHAATVAERELASAIDNPVVLPDEGRVESNGNFHGAPVGLRARLPRDRRRRRRLDQRAAYRPVPRQGPQPRAAAVPRRRPRRRQRADDRAVHPGRDRQRAEAAGRAGLGRLDPVQRDAGGPRLDGLVRRAQAAALRRRADPGRRDRGAHRRPGARPAGPARARRPPPPPSYACCGRPASRAPAPTGTCPPRSRPPSRSSSPAPSSAPSKK